MGVLWIDIIALENADVSAISSRDYRSMGADLIEATNIKNAAAKFFAAG